MEDRIVIFGTGKFYQNRKKILFENNIHVSAFLDNDTNKHGTILDGVPVYSPNKIKEICYDRILLMGLASDEMQSQLLNLGVQPEKILLWRDTVQFFAWAKRNVFVSHYSNMRQSNKNGKKILIITETLCYNGGAMAAVYTAEALQAKGLSVILAAPIYEKCFIEEMNNKGLDLVVIPSLKFMFPEQKEWIKQFDIVFVNTFCMLKCACECNKIMPTVWWLHEPSDKYQSFYKETISAFPECADINILSKIDTYAVSGIAANNFNEAFDAVVVKNKLPLAIPDEAITSCEKMNGKTVFVAVGDISDRKGQLFFCEAAKRLAKTRQDFEFWMVGRKTDSQYCQQLMHDIEGCKYIRFLGYKTHEEMRLLYQSVDVVVCSSLEETLSIVIIEGMMNGKTCITTDKTGIAEYIQNGQNGFVIQAESSESLAEKAAWCIDNKEKMAAIGKAARLTYEKNFIMDVFSNNVFNAIKNCENKWRKSHGQ